MTFNQYQKETAKLNIHKKELNFILCTLGLVGEAGEVSEHVKKFYRDDRALDVDEIKKELGDVLWYTAELGRSFGLKLEDIAKANIDKLEARQKERGR